MHTKELNAVDLVICMGKYSLLVAVGLLFYRNVCRTVLHHVIMFLHDSIQGLFLFGVASSLYFTFSSQSMLPELLYPSLVEHVTSVTTADQY